jgi:hypothetical protein
LRDWVRKPPEVKVQFFMDGREMTKTVTKTVVESMARSRAGGGGSDPNLYPIQP